MRKIWLLATKTYRRYIRSGTFLILTFGLPVLMLIAGAAPLCLQLGQDEARLGYVDQTGQLAIPSTETPDNDGITISAYPSADAAQTALEQGHIDGYLVIPEGYFQGQTPRFYGQESPGIVMQETLAGFMRQALLADQPGWVVDRFSNPSELIYVARATGEVVEGAGVLVQVVTPLVLAMAFGLLVLTGSGQMGAAIVEEKDQRAMEMVITSLAARELVIGKVLGITLLTVTQAAIWATGAGIAIGLALTAVGGASLSIPWRVVSWALLLGVPGYFLFAVLAAGLGIIAGDRQQARQLSGLLGFLGLLPLYLLGALINAMDGPLVLGLTWFPLTAPMIALFRMALSQIPTWQLVVSLVILIASVAGSVWFVTRIFRAAMLVYGQSLRPRQIWRALRQA
jgi:ABC-2 type transport system permease protein